MVHQWIPSVVRQWVHIVLVVVGHMKNGCLHCKLADSVVTLVNMTWEWWQSNPEILCKLDATAIFAPTYTVFSRVHVMTFRVNQALGGTTYSRAWLKFEHDGLYSKLKYVSTLVIFFLFSKLFFDKTWKSAWHYALWSETTYTRENTVCQFIYFFHL